MTTGDVLPRSYLKFAALGFVVWIGLGVFLNPFFTDRYQQINAVLAGEAVLALVITTVAFLRARGIDERDEGRGTRDEKGLWTRGVSSLVPRPSSLLFLLIVFLGAIYLHRWNWLHPRFIDDDLINLRVAQTWGSTWRSLFTPFNEHLLVPTRLWAYAAVQLTTPESLPSALLVGIWTLFGLALVQLFLLARREFRSDAAGLLAAAGFSLTYVHHECLWWFMAAQWLWTLNVLLLVWLILDPERSTALRANLAALAAFAGPFAFSVGLLVGPAAAVWILCRWRNNRRRWWRPLVGSLIGLLVAAPLVSAGLSKQDPGAANVQLKWFEFNLWQGLGSTVRLAVDYLLFRTLGIPQDGLRSALGVKDPLGPVSPLQAAALFPLLAAIPAAVLVRWPQCWRLAPFVVVIVLNYGVVVPFRSWMDYPQMSNWTARYHLLPQLGLVLFLVGAWFEGRRPRKAMSVGAAMLIAAALFVYQESVHGRWAWQ